jgi:6-phosphogluconate dehydrogenase (decarboxylating)
MREEKIGFIGLGAMGSPMSQNLVKKGYNLTVCDLIAKRVEPLEKLGAQIADTPKGHQGRGDRDRYEYHRSGYDPGNLQKIVEQGS